LAYVPARSRVVRGEKSPFYGNQADARTDVLNLQG
jgi:hypothetical protein